MQVEAIQQNLPLGIIPKAQQQVRQGGFTGTAWTYDGYAMPAGKLERYIL